MRIGYSAPVNGYNQMLLNNALEYFKVEKLSYENAGLPVPTNIFVDPNNPTIPQYTYAGPGTSTGTDAFGIQDDTRIRYNQAASGVVSATRRPV